MKKRYNKKRVFGLLFFLVLIVIIIIVVVKTISYRNSYDYKFKEAGYTKEEIKDLKTLFSNDQLDNLLTLEYNANIIRFAKEKYFIYSNLNKYLDYFQKNSSKSSTEIVSIINVKADEDWYDETINVKLTDKNQFYILVNKLYYLDKDYNPNDIINTGLLYSYAGNKLREPVYQAFINMYSAAKEEDLNLIINSSYRSYDTQKELYDGRVNTSGVQAADNYAARPGHSEHQTGLAIDIDAFGKTEQFIETTEYTWMQDNAHKFGFILRYPEGKEYLTGYNYEPWHYRYVGVDLATKVKNEDITFDEYYAYYCEYKNEC